MAIENPKRLISVDEYHQMGKEGVFSEDERVELIEGEIIEMPPIGNPHATAVRRLTNLFTVIFHRRAVVDIQNPVQLGRWSEPLPDVKILAWRDDFYSAKTPSAEDVLLLVEVADSSLGYDRKVKAPLYARKGIREYWLLNLSGGVLEVYRNPGPDRYREIVRLGRGETVSLQAFPDEIFEVADLLGPAYSI